VQGWDKATTKINIIDKYKKDQINGTNFDKNSIMLYFYDSKLTKDKKGTNPNEILSIRDVIHMSKVYPGGKIDPKEFYLKTYGIQIKNKDIDDAYGSTNSKYLWIVLIILIVIGLIVGIFVRNNFKMKQYINNPAKLI